jgi:hypothetical protein
MQLLALLLLTQNWYSVAMNINGNSTELGSFDGATTYPASMPAILLGLAAAVISFLVVGWSRRIVFLTGSLVNLLLAFWLSLQISTKNIAALDVQLDRLTGIAKTHGVSGLSVSVTLYPWLWLAAAIITSAIALRLAVSKTAFVKQGSNKRSSKGEQLTAIDIWEQQRD